MTSSHRPKPMVYDGTDVAWQRFKHFLTKSCTEISDDERRDGFG